MGAIEEWHGLRCRSSADDLVGSVQSRAAGLDAGADESGSWLVTAPLPGESAISERWKRQPAIAVAAIGRGLRHLHDHAPIEGCPYSWSVERRVNNAHHQIENAATGRVTSISEPSASPTVGPISQSRRGARNGTLGLAGKAALLVAFGIEPDPERSRYYRLLWDLD